MGALTLARVRPYLELVRVFLTPSAAADSLAGYALAAAVAGSALSPGRAAGAAGTSVLLYGLGMAWNDLFDRAKDAAAAPGRPIPSRRISPRSAAAFSLALLTAALGLGAATGIAVPAALVAALALAYDSGGKAVPVLGPVLMGLCRSGNLLLGAAAAVGLERAAAEPALLGAAALLGLHVASVTAASELEEAPFDASRLLLRALPALLVPAALVLLRPERPEVWAQAVLLLALVGGALRAAGRAARTPASPFHGAAVFVRRALSGIFLVDAGALLALAPDRRLALAASAGLYALLAAGQVWKRAWMRRGSPGS
ncbi:MAG: UbiA family prenyltransferase [Planctomycetes bacterium]|nr:UbiA family prenyltransferase [Planctomycetota bacterium]